MINKILKNKVKLLIAIILILIIILVVSMFIFFTDNSTKPSYGNRLDGIEEVEISKKQTEDMKNKIKKNSNVKDVTYNIQGKIVNVTITVNSGDTLWSIAEYEQSQNEYYKNSDIRKVVSNIKQVNNLETCDLVENQNLIIPTTL